MHLNQDSTYDMLATLFTSFLSIKLVRLADRTEERVLPVPISFILDEFPNIGVVPDFKKKLATARSRRIGMSILFQNIPQLQNRYPDNQWEEILGGCDFSIFLGCNDMTTATTTVTGSVRLQFQLLLSERTFLRFVPQTMCRNIRNHVPLENGSSFCQMRSFVIRWIRES